MPGGPSSNGAADDDLPRAGLLQRLRTAIVKPVDPSVAVKPAGEPQSLAELEAQNKTADDKERLVGLIGAPVAAAIGFLVITDLVDHDPAARLSNGAVNKLHVSVSIYHDLFFVLIGLAVAMMVLGLLRKRLYLGMAMALYGLAVFNLKYWGFGVPFVMAAAWLLVRSYRIQQKVKAATAAEGGGPGPTTNGRSRPQSNKRYTRPAPNRRPTPRPDEG
jgi:hypothetical protein